MTEDANQETLARVLREAQAGDAEQRERLFAACRSFLGMVAQAELESSLRAKADASDLVQQTMLEAYRDFDRFDGQTPGEWRAWLRRILRHNLSDFIRHYRGTQKRQQRREIPLAAGRDEEQSGPPEPAAPGETPSRQLMREDEQLRLAAALADLSEDHAEVIILRNLERLPFDEVARRMNRTRPAVQMLWMRAIKKLQGVLGEEPE